MSSKMKSNGAVSDEGKGYGDLWKSGNIKFIGVGRTTDRVMIATYKALKTETIEPYLSTCRDLLHAPNLEKVSKYGRPIYLTDSQHNFFVSMDVEERFYIAITRREYPIRLGISLLEDLLPQFRSQFGSISLNCPAGQLDGKAKRLLQGTVEKFDDPSIDKISSIRIALDDVTSKMGQNLDNFIKTIDKTKDLEKASIILNEQAGVFHTRTGILQRREWWRKISYTVIGGIVTVVVVVIVCLAIFL